MCNCGIVLDLKSKVDWGKKYKLTQEVSVARISPTPLSDVDEITSRWDGRHSVIIFQTNIVRACDSFASGIIALTDTASVEFCVRSQRVIAPSGLASPIHAHVKSVIVAFSTVNDLSFQKVVG